MNITNFELHKTTKLYKTISKITENETYNGFFKKKKTKKFKLQEKFVDSTLIQLNQSIYQMEGNDES